MVTDTCAWQVFSKITKHQCLWEGLSYFVYFLHVVTHLWKLQCYHVILIGYGPSYQKFSEITNCQKIWKGLSDFDDFLDVVYLLLDRYPLKLQKYAILGWHCQT